jgi:hypothetical protein
MTDTADALTGARTLTFTVELDGETHDCEMTAPTFAGLDDLEDSIPDGADQTVIARHWIDEYLADPDIDGGDVPVHRALRVYQAMQTALVEASGISDALAEMPTDEGNG